MHLGTRATTTLGREWGTFCISPQRVLAANGYSPRQNSTRTAVAIRQGPMEILELTNAKYC